jgi:hypothetical protein
VKEEAIFGLYRKKQVGEDFTVEGFKRDYAAILGVRKMRAPEIKKEDVAQDYMEKVEPPRDEAEVFLERMRGGTYDPYDMIKRYPQYKEHVLADAEQDEKPVL